MRRHKLLFSIILLVFIALIFNKNFVSQTYHLAKNKTLIPLIYFQNKNNDSYLKKCFKENSKLNSNKSILVVGHAYGESEAKNLGIYPKLISYLKNKNQLFDVILIAGDLVRVPSKENYNIAMDQLKKFGKKIIISPGNHDVGFKFNDNKREIYKDFFNNFYEHYIFENNLIIALDTNINSTIDKNQFSWLKSIISENKNINNLIILTHQIPWRDNVKNKLLLDKHKKWELVSDNDNKLIKFSNVLNYIGTLNIETYFFSGSVNHDNYLYCYKKNKNTFVNSGVGVNKINSIILLNFFENEISLNYSLF